ncbi:hypothetical protein Moror_1608 [Moniliophthora roreri MCA 2997]|uniref:receptor protein-tyrosine kinase n=2 Tax=Moniliophthora roreri TaxID=221103 RepID=V2XIQ8_MONRO|nr:hypothetical protein Moror_1608 [Moniliophthora roreri MCA 2997]
MPLQPPFSLDTAGSTEISDKLAVPTQPQSGTLMPDTFKTLDTDMDTVIEPFTIPTMPINVYAAQSSVSEESSAPSSSTSSSSPSTATVVGATVGGIILLILVGLFVWLFLRRHRSKNKDTENLRWHMVQSRNVTKEDMNTKIDFGDVIDIRPLPCAREPRTPTQENPFLSDDEEGDCSETLSDSRRGSAASSIHFAGLPATPISSSFAVTQTGHYAPRQSRRQSQSKDMNWAENQTSLMSVLDFMKQRTEAQRK